MSTATIERDRVRVTCPTCGITRTVHRKTYLQIEAGTSTERCRPCGVRAAHRRPHEQARDNGPWREYAACRGMDTDQFFPPDNARGKLRDLIIADAQAICADCPVTAQCAAASAGERYGVWAGTDLEKARKRRKKAAA